MSTLLLRTAEDLAVVHRERTVDDLARDAGWRNLALAIHLGMDTAPLAGAAFTRINGVHRVSAAFAVPDLRTPGGKPALDAGGSSDAIDAPDHSHHSKFEAPAGEMREPAGSQEKA